MSSQKTSNCIENRKNAILSAALKCFLQYGYAKTCMDDVAKEANLSRPLIYLNFKNKENLYIDVIEYLIADRFELAEKILASKAAKKEKLTNILEILLLGIWEQIMGKPMSIDFYKTYHTLFNELAERYKYKIIAYIQNILVDQKTAEVFYLAVEGLKSDIPEAEVLRNRLRVLIDHFI